MIGLSINRMVEQQATFILMFISLFLLFKFSLRQSNRFSWTFLSYACDIFQFLLLLYFYLLVLGHGLSALSGGTLLSSN